MNMKMKTLSIAVLGLAGIAFAGSASAACVPGNLSAWSSTSAIGGTLTVATGGLEPSSPSECRLDAAVTGSLGLNVSVRDDTPAAEVRYRAQFLVDPSLLTSQNLAQGFKVFGATTLTAANGVSDLVRLTVVGNVTGTAKTLGIFTACAGQPGNVCSASLPLAAGVNRIEIDWVKGAAGTLKVWVNNTNEATPTTTLNGNSSSWTGVDFASLGVIGASPVFRSAQVNKAVKLDKFDSRRQTFIGG